MTDIDAAVARVLRAYAGGYMASVDMEGGTKRSPFHAGITASAFMLVSAAESLESGAFTWEDLIKASPMCGRMLTADGLKAEVDAAA